MGDRRAGTSIARVRVLSLMYVKLKGEKMLAVVDGEKVRRMRLSRNMSVWELCEASSLSESTLRKIERGRARVRCETVGKIADVFGVERAALARAVRRRPTTRLTLIRGGYGRIRVA